MIAPCEELKPFIQCYWSIKSEHRLQKSIVNKIISDGGSGVVFNFGSRFYIQADEDICLVRDKCFFTGVTDKTAYLELAGIVDAFGVRFYPGVCSVIMPEMMSAGSLISKLESGKFSGLYDSLLKNDDSERKQILDEFLIREFNQFINMPLPWGIQTANFIKANGGSIKVEETADNFALSRRQFSRKFKEEVGLTPKQYSKIVRINNVRSALKTQDIKSLTTVGYDFEYYDQAHFIKEFKDIVELTPKEYFRNKRMSRFYNNK